MEDIESMNDDLDEFSHDDESGKNDGGCDEDTEYEDELIENNRKIALVKDAAQSSRLSRVAGIQSRLTDPMTAGEIGEQSSGFDTISPNRRMTKAVQPSKLFETSPIISATMN